jgi:hypothetical protein
VSTEAQEVEAAFKRAWRIMWELWPRKFNDFEWENKKSMYLKKLYNLDAAVICEAAEQLVTTKDFPPTPNEFATLALRLHRDRHPSDPMSRVQSSDPQILALAVEVRTRQERMDALAKYVLRYCTTGKLSELSQVWSLLWEMCETEEERIALHNGTISKKKVNEAITAHRAGRKVGVPFRPSPAQQEAVSL